VVGMRIGEIFALLNLASVARRQDQHIKALEWLESGLHLGVAEEHRGWRSQICSNMWPIKRVCSVWRSRVLEPGRSLPGFGTKPGATGGDVERAEREKWRQELIRTAGRGHASTASPGKVVRSPVVKPPWPRST